MRILPAARDNLQCQPRRRAAAPDSKRPIPQPTPFTCNQSVKANARIAIGSPFPGRLLLTVETDDVIHTQVIDMKST